MKTFKNYFKIIFANKWSLILYIVLFTILLSINNGSNVETLDTNYHITVIDKANNSESKNLIDFLETKYRVSKENISDEKAKDKLFGNITAYVLFIDKENNLSYFAKDDSVAPTAINLSIDEYLNTNATLEKYNIENSNKESINILSENTNFKILNNTTRNNTEFYYTYLTYIIILFSLSIIYLGYNSFLRDGVENRVRVSKTKFNKFIISIYASSLILMLFVCLGFSLLELFKNKTSLEKYPLYLINLIAFTIPMVALAYLVSSRSKDSSNNGALNNVISLSLCFITGVFVPQEFLPQYLIKLSSIFPPYWYLEGIKASNKMDFNMLLKVILVQGIMTSVLILINMIVNRQKKGDFSYSR
ncbi:MAG: ABC transporter permease [Miniphocaeibacter sp.]|uniref:ABC transporter permease n=1 Tax=Miniphocaeibacter sp. TaxID=3100973 RepID=UPI003BB0AAF4